MSDFEAFEPTRRGGASIGSVENPSVTITKEGVYLGVVVWREILDEPNAIEYQVDAANARVGFQPVDSNDAAGAYSVTEYQVRGAPVWDALGMEIDESERVPLDVDSEVFPVVDLSRFVPDDESGDGTDASDESDDAPLDADRVAAVMDAAGINGVSPDEFAAAVDGARGPYDVAQELDIARGDADAIIRHLGLADALGTGGEHAQQRLRGDGGGETA